MLFSFVLGEDVSHEKLKEHSNEQQMELVKFLS